jgi:hypothetical protein
MLIKTFGELKIGQLFKYAPDNGIYRTDIIFKKHSQNSHVVVRFLDGLDHSRYNYDFVSMVLDTRPVISMKPKHRHRRH